MGKRKSNLRQAVRLMWSTRPFLRARLAVYGVFFFATIGYTATFFAILNAYGDSTVAQLAVMAAAFLVYFVGKRYLARQLTYAGHAPHVQAMVEALKGRTLPKGVAQIDTATRHIDENFRDASRLYQLEQSIGRVLQETRDVVIQPGSLNPLPGFSKLGRVGWLIGRVANKSVRDGIFGYSLWTEDRNVWRSARRGVLIYAADAPPIMTSAIRVSALGGLVGLAIIGLSLWPGWPLIQWGLSAKLTLFFWVIVGYLKALWVLKAALYDPIGVAWMISAFVKHAETTETESSEWANKLSKVSKRYRELSERSRKFDKPDDKPAPSGQSDDFSDTEPDQPKIDLALESEDDG